MPKISHTEARELFNYDPATGNLIWKKKVAKKITPGDIAGHADPINGYVLIGLHYRLYRAHQLVWFWHHGVWPKQLDHKNRNKRDNRIENLREATPAQNIANSSRISKASGVKGVIFQDGKPCAVINVDGRKIWLGTFDTIAEAAEAYRKGAEKFYGEFAHSSGAPHALTSTTVYLPARRRRTDNNHKGPPHSEPPKTSTVNTSGVGGVSKNGTGWRVVIKGTHYGSFRTFEEACLIRNAVWEELMQTKK